MSAGLTDTIVEWESKELSNEKIKFPIKANHSLSPKLRWMLLETRQSNFYSKKCSKFIYCL